MRPRQCAASRDRRDRCRERERPHDLPDRAGSATKALASAELRVVVKARARRARGLGAGLGRGRGRDPLVVEAAPALRGGVGQAPEHRGGIHDGGDLRLFLEHGLEERQLEPRVEVEGECTGGDLLARADEHERVKQLVGDEVGGDVVLLRPPGGRNALAQLGLEAGAPQRNVAEHAHHVDHERLALRPVERLAATVVDEREQVAGALDRRGVAAGALGRAAQPREDATQRRD